MKKALLAFLLLGAMGCHKTEKPYIIVAKGDRENGFCYFGYRESNGRYFDFHDSCHLYHIGDTIK